MSEETKELNGATIKTPFFSGSFSSPLVVLLLVQCVFMLLLYSLHERQARDHDNIAMAVDRNSCVLSYEPSERKEFRDIIKKFGYSGACPDLLKTPEHKPGLIERIFGG